MVGPIDYTMQVLDPIQGYMKGLAFGENVQTARLGREQTRQAMGIQAAQEARAAEEFQIRKAEAARKVEEAQRGQQVLADLFSNPNPTSDDFMGAYVANPAIREEIKFLMTNQTSEQNKALLTSSQNIYAAAAQQNPDVLRRILTEQRDAMSASGNEQMVRLVDEGLKMLDTDPAGAMQQLRATTGLTILGLGGDISKINEALGLPEAPELTEAFRTVDQKLRAANIVPIDEGGDGTYEELMRQTVEKGGDGFALVVDPATGAVSFSQGSGNGIPKPSAGYVTVSGDGGVVEQRVISGSPAAQEVAAKAAKIDASIQQADALVALVEAVRDDPELDAVTGFAEGKLETGRPSLSPETIQARRDLIVRIDQLQGNVFLQAYESLKGSGQITEIEGQKAEAAIARMNRTQGGPAFKQALDEFLDVISTAQRRMQSERAGLPKETSPKGANTPAATTPSGEIVGGSDVPLDFSSMTKEDLAKVDVMSLTEEQAIAMLARFEELK